MSIGATIMHVVLWYGKDIIEIIRVSFFFFMVLENYIENLTNFF